MGLLIPANATEWLTLLLVIITALYAVATFRILKANQATVKAMQEQTEALLRPYVSVEVTPRPGSTLILMLVRNTGKSAAEGLLMSIDKQIHWTAGGSSPFKTFPFFQGRTALPSLLVQNFSTSWGQGIGCFPRTARMQSPSAS